MIIHIVHYEDDPSNMIWSAHRHYDNAERAKEDCHEGTCIPSDEIHIHSIELED